MALEIKALTKDKPPHLSALLIAPAKFGKTTALASLPKPLLIGDVDGGFLSLLNAKRVNPEGIFVAEIKTYEDAKEFFRTGWKQGPDGKPFASVAVDTFSWLMTNVIKPGILGARETMELRDWGLYLEKGLYLARMAHELARRVDGCHVVLSCHEADKSDPDGAVGKLGPAISGQLFDILPGMPDFVIFLRIRPTGKVDDKRRAIVERQFQLGADARTPAGSRASTPDFVEPDFGKLWEYVSGNGGNDDK